MSSTILVAGYYGFGNLGDEVILSGLIADLRDVAASPDVVVLSNDPTETEHTHGVRAVHWRDLQVIRHLLMKSDLLVIGGGGLFQDYWPVPFEDVLTDRQQGLSYYAALVGMAQVLAVPHVVYGVGAGPLLSKEAREMAAAILRTAQAVSVRDQHSAAEIARLDSSGDPTSVRLGADLAVRLPQREPGPKRAARSREASRERVIAVNLRYWDIGVEPSAVEDAVAEALDRWLDLGSWRIRFLPFQSLAGGEYEDDRAVIERVRKRMRFRSMTAIETGVRFDNVSELLTGCDLSLATRYHAALLSVLSGVPTAVLSYDPKCQALLQDLGNTGQSLNLMEATAVRIFDLLGRTLERWSHLETGIDEAVAQLHERGQRQVTVLDLGMRSAERRAARAPSLRQVLAERLSQGHMVASWPLAPEEARELPARLKTLSQQVASLKRSHEDLGTELEGARASYAKADRELRRSRQEIRSVTQERNKLSQLLEKSHRRAEASDRQLQASLRDRTRLQGELQRIRGTLGFRLLAAYWRLMNRLLPTGSRRRVLFDRVAGRLRSISERATGALAWISHLPGRGSTEWRAEALWLENHLAAFDQFCDRHIVRGGRVAIILAPTAFDRAEGQRSVHLAGELAHRGIPVLFCYWRWRRDLRPEQHVPHPAVFHTPLDLLLDRPAEFLGAMNAVEKWLILEFPYPGFFDLLSQAHSGGWITIYDVVDDWEEFKDVGQAPWYEPEFERHLVNSVDLVLATSPALAGKIEAQTGRQAHLLANAAATEVLAGRRRDALKPDGLTVGYFGSLTPAWFDWELLSEAARQRPSWRFELVGPPPVNMPRGLPVNVVLLGKRKQSELGAIAAGWQVAVAPFRQGPLARAVDAIKVYEYLALGLPVVVSGIQPPAGSEPFVLQTGTQMDFILAIERLSQTREEGREARIAFGADNTWAKRGDQLVEYIERSTGRVAEKLALVAAR